LIDSGKADFDAFYIHQFGVFIAKGDNSGIFQSGDGIIVALLAVIVAVIIGQVCSFYRASGKDRRIFGRGFEGIGFVLAVFRFCQSAFHIYNRQVILLEDGAYMLEKIIGAVLFVVGIQAGGTGKRLISSQCTVTHGADSNRYWLAGKDGLVSVDHESLYLNIRLFCLVALILRVLFFPGRALKFFY